MKYDPSKTYTWKNDDLFSISGKDFGLILNSLRAILSTEAAQTTMLASRANDAIEKIVAENVEKGTMIEANPIKPIDHENKNE